MNWHLHQIGQMDSTKRIESGRVLFGYLSIGFRIRTVHNSVSKEVYE